MLVLPGRGEHPGVYERFGRRIAADGYLVRALPVAPGDSPETVSALITGAAAATSVEPLVLVGSDTGALHALALAADGTVKPDGLVLAALAAPVAAARADIGSLLGDWEAELAARTACPAHRARLTADASFERGRLHDPIAPRLSASLHAAAGPARLDVPVLLVHGGADPITPVRVARELAGRLPRAELAVVASAPHDVLNDATHRTVAAQIVQWLERLRGGPRLAALIEVETEFAAESAGSTGPASRHGVPARPSRSGAGGA